MENKFELEAPTGKAKKKIVKPQYTELFEKWWAAYPRKTAKFKAFQSWQSHVDETDTAIVVIADTEKRNRMQFWAADKSKIPMPTTFLNQHRWEDEWEDEVKTRGRENIATAHRSENRMPQAKVDDGPPMSGWMAMLNRLMFSYLRLLEGTSEAMMKAMVETKNEVFDELESAANEEIASADDKSKAKGDMAYLMAETLLTRLDQLNGKKYMRKIIDTSKRAA